MNCSNDMQGSRRAGMHMEVVPVSLMSVVLQEAGNDNHEKNSRMQCEEWNEDSQSSSGIFDKKFRLVRNSKTNQSSSSERLANDPFSEVRQLLQKKRASDAWVIYRLKVQEGYPPNLDLVQGIVSSFPDGVSTFKWKGCREALIEMGRCFSMDTTLQTLKMVQHLSALYEEGRDTEDDLLSIAVNIFIDCVPRQLVAQEEMHVLSELSEQLFKDSHWASLTVFVSKQAEKGFMPSPSSLENVLKYHVMKHHHEELMNLMRKVDKINMQLPVHLYDRVRKCLELSAYPEDSVVILQMKGRYHRLDPIEQSLAASQISDPNLKPSLPCVNNEDDHLPDGCDGVAINMTMQKKDQPNSNNGTRQAISLTIQKSKDVETLAQIFLTIYEKDRIYLSEEVIQNRLSTGILSISSKPHLVYRDFVGYIQGEQALDHDGLIYLVLIGKDLFMSSWRKKSVDAACHILETISQMDYNIILAGFVNLSSEKLFGRYPFNNFLCLIQCCLRTKSGLMACKLLLTLQNNEWDHMFWDRTTKTQAWQQCYEDLAHELTVAVHLELCLQLLVRIGESHCRNRMTPKGRRLTKESFNYLLGRAYERSDVTLVNRVIHAIKEFSTFRSEHIHRLVTNLVTKRDTDSLKEARELYRIGLEEGTYLCPCIKDDLHEGRIQVTSTSEEIYIILYEFFLQSDTYLNNLFSKRSSFSRTKGEMCNILTMREMDICFRLLITVVGTHLESSSTQEVDLAIDGTIIKVVQQLGLLIPNFDVQVQTLNLQEKVVMMKMDDIKRRYLANRPPQYAGGGKGDGGPKSSFEKR